MSTDEILKLKYRKVDELQSSLQKAQSEEDRQLLFQLLQVWKSYP
ncbi:MAG TPA: hypothetical protein V6D07_03210 [Trichocoleus sp.]